MAQDWASDVRKYVPDADDLIIAGIVRYCGIALQKRDSSLVSFSDAKETDRVRNNFLKKKLALMQADDVLDAAIAAVGARMKDDRTKHRVTVYYLLADHFDMLQLFHKKGAAKLAPVVEAIEADDGDSTSEGVASLASLGSGAKKKAKAMVNTGSEAVADAGKMASKAGAAAVDAAGDAVAGAADLASKAGSAVAGAAEAAASGVSDVASKAAIVAGDAVADVAAAAGKAGAAVVGAAGAAVAGAAGVASLAGDKLSSAASGAVHGLKGDAGEGKGGSMGWLWLLILIALALLIWWLI